MDPDSAKHDLPISDAELSPGIISCGRTDVAQRKHNEDAFLISPELGVLVITHYQRLLNYIKPNFVHVMYDGRIVESGGPELALQLEEQGYDWVREKHGSVPAG